MKSSASRADAASLGERLNRLLEAAGTVASQSQVQPLLLLALLLVAFRFGNEYPKCGEPVGGQALP